MTSPARHPAAGASTAPVRRSAAKSGIGSSRAEILRTLTRRIEEIEARSAEVGTRSTRGSSALRAPSSALHDGWFPGRPLPPGALVELLPAADGAGAWTLALFMAKQACGERNALVVIDTERCFYPPAAVKLGVDLDRTIVVRPATRRDAQAALDQSLRCASVGAVVGWCDRLSVSEARQLQLAAETGGGIGLLLRPTPPVSPPSKGGDTGGVRGASFATLRLLVAPVASTDTLRRVRVEVARCRGGKCGQSFILEIDDETGHVRVPAELASATAGTRSARALG